MYATELSIVGQLHAYRQRRRTRPAGRVPSPDGETVVLKPARLCRPHLRRFVSCRRIVPADVASAASHGLCRRIFELSLVGDDGLVYGDDLGCPSWQVVDRLVPAVPEIVSCGGRIWLRVQVSRPLVYCEKWFRFE
jgi:hypothetical protein